MADKEKCGFRDATYSAFHRTESIKRFIGDGVCANQIGMIDLDFSLWIEFSTKSYVPLVLVETARYSGNHAKSSTVLKQLCTRANIPGLCVLYEPSSSKNPADRRYQDITQFHVRHRYPHDDNQWLILSPHEYVDLIVSMRRSSCDMSLMSATDCAFFWIKRMDESSIRYLQMMLNDYMKAKQS